MDRIRIKDNEFIDTNLIGVVQPNVLQKDKIDNPDEYEILRNLIDLSNKEDARSSNMARKLCTNTFTI